MRPANVLHLGVKELRGLARDRLMLLLIVHAFTFAVYTAATSAPESLHKAPIAIVDEDASALTARIVSAFHPPHFLPPVIVGRDAVDAGLDAGRFTFALDLPAGLQRDLLAGRSPAVQLNVDATRMTQAFTGSGHVQAIVAAEVAEFLQDTRRAAAPPPVEAAVRMRFNPTLAPAWFASVMEIVNAVTMLSIVLTGAALIREREHGTIEHLLAMPVTPAEIMASKIWSMGLVVLAACALSLRGVVQGLLAVPIEGSVPLFLAGAALHLFATTAMGILMATVARSMPQFGLLLMLVLLPLQMLSGASTPRESMPGPVQQLMLAAPTTHFVMLSQAILYRGAGLPVVWPQLVALAGIGAAFLALALARFRRTIASMA